MGTLAPAGATGACGGAAGDSISVNTPTRTALQTGVAALCGALSGQHLIVEVAPGNNAMAATLNIDTAAVAGNRMWKILVKCVECDSADRAPMGCNQYFTGASGRISSFNGAQALTTAAAATGTTGCTIQFLRVPDAVVKTAAGVVENGRVCGGLLSNVAGQVVSEAIDNMGFEIGVFSDGA